MGRATTTEAPGPWAKWLCKLDLAHGPQVAIPFGSERASASKCPHRQHWGIVNHWGHFTHVFTGWEGSVHDAHTFCNSPAPRADEEWALLS
ncbi:hypothetical protein Y1Q_0021359 [Alligator mississippiensis]|uniref:DDE Tnp4 domain-containing protein n=1 Tax=Alligator mississippiensis TaxID=8496 RepID=A0A151P9D0_ALLMI|nr:hypothetical protein Y1Q_0021359 [Alligator mississippiensis]